MPENNIPLDVQRLQDLSFAKSPEEISTINSRYDSLKAESIPAQEPGAIKRFSEKASDVATRAFKGEYGSKIVEAVGDSAIGRGIQKLHQINPRVPGFSDIASFMAPPGAGPVVKEIIERTPLEKEKRLSDIHDQLIGFYEGRDRAPIVPLTLGETKQFSASGFSSMTGGVITPDVGAPENFNESMASVFGSVAGTAASLHLIGSGVSSLATKTPLLGSFLAKSPTIAKYFTSIGAMDIYGQLDPELSGNWSKRLKKIAIDTPTAIVWTAMGGLPAKYSIPASFTVGYGSAKLGGADDKEAIVWGIALGALDAASKAEGIGKHAMTTKQAESSIMNESKAVFKKAGLEVKEGYTNAEVEKLRSQAAKTYHPDINPQGAEIMKRINVATDFLKKIPIEKRIIPKVKNDFQLIREELARAFGKERPAAQVAADMGEVPVSPETLQPPGGFSKSQAIAPVGGTVVIDGKVYNIPTPAEIQNIPPTEVYKTLKNRAVELKGKAEIAPAREKEEILRKVDNLSLLAERTVDNNKIIVSNANEILPGGKIRAEFESIKNIIKSGTIQTPDQLRAIMNSNLNISDFNGNPRAVSVKFDYKMFLPEIRESSPQLYEAMTGETLHRKIAENELKLEREEAAEVVRTDEEFKKEVEAKKEAEDLRKNAIKILAKRTGVATRTISKYITETGIDPRDLLDLKTSEIQKAILTKKPIVPTEAKPEVLPAAPLEAVARPEIAKRVEAPSYERLPELERVLMELESAQPGERVPIGGRLEGAREWIGVPSTFPKWVPERLRATDLFRKVLDDFEGRKLPKVGTKEEELYNLVLNRATESQIKTLKEFGVEGIEEGVVVEPEPGEMFLEDLFPEKDEDLPFTFAKLELSEIPDLTTRVLKILEKSKSVKPDAIRQIVNRPEIKKVERDLILGVLDEYLKKESPRIFSGREVAKEVKEIGTEGGVSDFLLDQIKKENYQIKDEKISDLIKNDPDLDAYIKSGEIREFEGEPFMMDPIVSSSGEVLDGYNRIAQKYADGEESISVLYGTSPEAKEVEPRVSVKEFSDMVRREIESAISPVDQSLVEEAKKYKSAEEFVRAQGRLVYHGTAATFDAFDNSQRGSITGAQSAKGAVWFTDDPSVARAYSIYAAEDGPINKLMAEADRLEKIAQKSGLESDWKKYDEITQEMERQSTYDATLLRRKNASVKEAVVRGNLLTVDAKGRTPQELSDDGSIDSWLNQQLDKARRADKDGVIFKNLDDAVGLYDTPSTHYAIFDNKNIIQKSQLTDIWNQAHQEKFRTDSLIEEAKKYRNVEEFIGSKFNEVPAYGMAHRPSWEGMPPAHNLLEGEAIPKDVYEHPEFSIASGRNFKTDQAAQESWKTLQSVRNKPDAEITVYRATRRNELNIGDWITFSKTYAEDSIEGKLEKVYSFKIKAKDAIFAGDDINEFGYYPKSKLIDAWNRANLPENKDLISFKFEFNKALGIGEKPSEIIKKAESTKVKEAEIYERPVKVGTEADVARLVDKFRTEVSKLPNAEKLSRDVSIIEDFIKSVPKEALGGLDMEIVLRTPAQRIQSLFLATEASYNPSQNLISLYVNPGQGINPANFSHEFWHKYNGFITNKESQTINKFIDSVVDNSDAMAALVGRGNSMEANWLVKKYADIAAREGVDVKDYVYQEISARMFERYFEEANRPAMDQEAEKGGFAKAWDTIKSVFNRIIDAAFKMFGVIKDTKFSVAPEVESIFRKVYTPGRPRIPLEEIPRTEIVAPEQLGKIRPGEIENLRNTREAMARAGQDTTRIDRMIREAEAEISKEIPPVKPAPAAPVEERPAPVKIDTADEPYMIQPEVKVEGNIVIPKTKVPVPVNIIQSLPQIKDKKVGILYSRETLSRNIEDISPNPQVAASLMDFLPNPISANETAHASWITTQAAEVEVAAEKYGIRKGSPESGAVQLYGEKEMSIDQLQAEFPEKWKEIKALSEDLRQRYDGIIELWNNVRASYGLEPVPPRDNYFRHGRFLKSYIDRFGVVLGENSIPTHIVGLTHLFKPNSPFSSAALKRETDKTDIDALAGFQDYLKSVGRSIFHTDSILRIKALEVGIRKNAEINPDVQLPNFVGQLNSYFNYVAGKKSAVDRNAELEVGRAFYDVTDWINRKIGQNFIALNVSANLTNLIPALTQMPATTGKVFVLKGLGEAHNIIGERIYEIDGERSSFLTRRFLKEAIDPRGWEKAELLAQDSLSIFDRISSKMVVAAKYYENVAKGMEKKEAMDAADKYAAGVILDRSIGQSPTLFNMKAISAFTIFQREVNNQWSFIFKDIPKMYKGEGKHLNILSAIIQLAAYSFFFNTMFEKLTGRRPALDPIYAGSTLMGWTPEGREEEVPVRAGKAVKQILGQIPFVGDLLGEGRLPLTSGMPDVLGMLNGDVEPSREVAKFITQYLVPFGGSQIKKTYEGMTTFISGGVYKGRQLLYPVEPSIGSLIKLALFGKYSPPEAKEYFESESKAFSDQQTQAFLQILDTQGAEAARAYYDQIRMQQERSKKINKEVREAKEELLDTMIESPTKRGLKRLFKM